MNILVDENIPLITVAALRAMRHDVLDIRQTPEQGTPDRELWQLVQAQRRLLITTDKGFVEHAGSAHWGVLIVRLKHPNQNRIHERVMRALRQFPADQWPGLLVVMRDRVKSVRRSSRPRG